MDKLVDGYSSTEGRRVLDSFSPSTHQGDQNLYADIASAMASFALEKAGSKVVGGVVKAVDGKLNTPKPAEQPAASSWNQSPVGAVADNEAGGFSYYDQYKKPDGSWDWPKDLGFSGDPSKNLLPVGTKLDRYGGPDGAFLSPLGVPFEQRALAPGSRAGGYYQY